MSGTASLEAELESLFRRPAEHGVSLAAVVMIGGEVVAERYGVQPANDFGGERRAVDADTPLVSWSMAKSITHAAVGLAVGEGLVDVDAPAPVPGWQGTDKERITLLDLLEMRPGLHFVEDYEDAGVSNCLEMLFGDGRDDHAAYAAALPLEHEPGAVWNYSSGTTNIVCRVLGEAVGGEQAMRTFLTSRLFSPAGMASADPVFDPAGTFVGSSYVYATARDFARFGELYRNDGTVGGQQVLPAGWVDHARRSVATDPESGFGYGRHWWLWPQYRDAIAAHGYEGQYTVVVPDRELVLVHLGKTPASVRPVVVEALHRLIALV